MPTPTSWRSSIDIMDEHFLSVRNRIRWKSTFLKTFVPRWQLLHRGGKLLRAPCCRWPSNPGTKNVNLPPPPSSCEQLFTISLRKPQIGSKYDSRSNFHCQDGAQWTSGLRRCQWEKINENQKIAGSYSAPAWAGFKKTFHSRLRPSGRIFTNVWLIRK